MRVDWPPPQLFEQLDQFVHADSTQCTGHGPRSQDTCCDVGSVEHSTPPLRACACTLRVLVRTPPVPQDKLRFRFDVRVDHVSFQADGIDRPLAVALSSGGKVAQMAPVRMGENTRSARNQTLIGHTQTKPRRSRRPRWQILPRFLQRPQLLEALRRLLLFAHQAWHLFLKMTYNIRVHFR